jgi:hypothetical protein
MVTKNAATQEGLDDGIPFRGGEGGRSSAPLTVIAGHASPTSDSLHEPRRISHASAVLAE